MYVRHGLPHPYVVVPGVVLKNDTNTVQYLWRSTCTLDTGAWSTTYSEYSELRVLRSKSSMQYLYSSIQDTVQVYVIVVRCTLYRSTPYHTGKLVLVLEYYTTGVLSASFVPSPITSTHLTDLCHLVTINPLGVANTRKFKLLKHPRCWTLPRYVRKEARNGQTILEDCRRSTIMITNR